MKNIIILILSAAFATAVLIDNHHKDLLHQIRQTLAEQTLTTVAAENARDEFARAYYSLRDETNVQKQMKIGDDHWMDAYASGYKAAVAETLEWLHEVSSEHREELMRRATNIIFIQEH